MFTAEPAEAGDELIILTFHQVSHQCKVEVRVEIQPNKMIHLLAVPFQRPSDLHKYLLWTLKRKAKGFNEQHPRSWLFSPQIGGIYCARPSGSINGGLEMTCMASPYSCHFQSNFNTKIKSQRLPYVYTCLLTLQKQFENE